MVLSVITTCYNKEKYIAETIESVLNSNFEAFEYIIVDDCSLDNSINIINDYARKDKRIQVYINDENKGDYPTRNIAARYAKGKYIKFLDGDDTISSNSLGNFIINMEMYPSAAVGLGARITYHNNISPKLFTPYESYYQHFLEGLDFFVNAPSSTIIKRDVFIEFKGFLEEKHLGDTDLWYRIALKYDVLTLNSYTHWRKAEGQESVISSKSSRITKIRKEMSMRYLLLSPLSAQEKKIAKKKLEWSYFSGKVIKPLLKGQLRFAINNSRFINFSILIK